jgi:DNA polymerase IV
VKEWPHVYAHVDMDAFFVSVELLRRPELRGKPVIVAAGTEPHTRGVVAAASYEARKFGVHSALPLVVAKRRCPEMVMVDRDMAAYSRISKQVMGLLRGYSEKVEVAGLDEAYLDLSPSPAPKARARALKAEVLAKTGLIASIGLGPNKLIAKIASDLDKPDGFCVLDAERMLEAVGERSARLIPGIGPKTYERLERAGIRTVAELAGASDSALARAFGSGGQELRDRARGIDERQLETQRVRKSESRETTFAADVTDRGVLVGTIERLASSVCAGLGKEGFTGRTVTLKLRLAPFRTFTRSRTLPEPTVDAAEVSAVATELLDAFDEDGAVRLLGIGLSSLERSAPAPSTSPDSTADAGTGAGLALF